MKIVHRVQVKRKQIQTEKKTQKYRHYTPYSSHFGGLTPRGKHADAVYFDNDRWAATA